MLVDSKGTLRYLQIVNDQIHSFLKFLKKTTNKTMIILIKNTLKYNDILFQMNVLAFFICIFCFFYTVMFKHDQVPNLTGLNLVGVYKGV